MASLSDEQQMLLETASDLAENEFAEKAYEWQGETPWENLETLAEHGFLGINFDEEYGGAGMSEFEAMLLNEAVGRVCPDTASFLNSLHMVAPRAIDMFGTPEAKAAYLPPLTEGNDFIAICISEPEAGSDVHSMNTTIEERDGDLVLNGEKTWVSRFDEASAGVTWVKFPDGLGTVIVDFDDPGVEVSNHYTNMAGHEQTHYYMEDVVIPPENVLTRGEDAFKEQLKALNWERLAVASISNTWALAALEHALEYAQDREQFGQPIAEFQGLEWKLSEMVTHLEASRALTYRAAEDAVARGRVPDPLQTGAANLFSGQTAETVISEALQICGANGYQQGHPLEYLYRLQRGWRFAGGTDEVQKNTIARWLKRGGAPSLLN
ncbi:acyl-CoA dehydrogenase [Natrinema saccharevitans]|uniref:Acyl-CoA dehydrogenase n=1 Tax=Natrinema saccharevitans TaxID=301967 RepID=A0A1S8ASG0_9EURY|nr:acyl-CoA dehydrogenase family protein [Natrinema saccharevitans]OLZ39434.1 acyl-CoA dehydrogenase [Natrinema saccharevitans]